MLRTVRRLATKPFLVMPAVAVLLLGGWWFLRSDASGGSTEQAVGDQVIEATLGSMTETITAEGTLAYAESEDFSFAASGTVVSVNVEAGQSVSEGDVLAALDSPELEAAVASADTVVAEAEARLADDQAAGASDAQIAADESSLASAEDQLASAQEALDGAQLVASFDGVVAAVDIVEGEELGSGGSSGTSLSGTGTGSGQASSTLGSGGNAAPGGAEAETATTAQIQVVSASRFVVEVGFDDTDIANVAEGLEATISLSSSSGGGFPGGGFPGGGRPGGGFPGGGGGGGPGGGFAGGAEEDDEASLNSDVAAATGTVTEVSAIADASSGVATYPVTVEVTDETGDYNAGATVLVEVAYGDPTEVVQVPSFAVTSADDGSSTVAVRTEDGDESRTVTTGDTSGTMIAITSGLEAGEQVVVSVPAGGGLGGGRGGGFPGGGPGGATGADGEGS